MAPLPPPPGLRRPCNGIWLLPGSGGSTLLDDPSSFWYHRPDTWLWWLVFGHCQFLLLSPGHVTVVAGGCLVPASFCCYRPDTWLWWLVFGHCQFLLLSPRHVTVVAGVWSLSTSGIIAQTRDCVHYQHGIESTLSKIDCVRKQNREIFVHLQLTQVTGRPLWSNQTRLYDTLM